jgi:hypothetical protein
MDVLNIGNLIVISAAESSYEDILFDSVLHLIVKKDNLVKDHGTQFSSP